MNEKTISVISLSNRDFPGFEAKLAEAAQWIEFAAGQGADLAVLPEAINFYKGDGPGNPHAMTFAEAALDDWEAQTNVLRQTAKRFGLAVTIPVVTRESGRLTNSFFLISKTGQTIGRYQKVRLTSAELTENVCPGRNSLMEWEGIKVGGAICFDTCFPHVIEEQARAGAQLFLVPSLWPGGSQLNYFALKYSVPMALAYPAWSRIIDATGQEVAEGGYRHETLRFGFGAPMCTATINFDRVALYANGNQEKMVDVQRAFGSKVRVQFDQQNCLFFLESRSSDFSVRDIMKKFGLISAQDYFEECEQKNQKS